MIEVRSVSKSFGNHKAVDDLSFTVRPGVVTGFLGPNGAGKSTTMRMALGLTRPDAGEVLVGGRRYGRLTAPLREVGDFFGLVGRPDVAGRRPGGFSLGMSQRLGIAAALLGDPVMVLLDEPV